MTIPQLFYLGVLAGVLSRIPGLDLGSLFFALHLNFDLYSKAYKKTFISLFVCSLGYISTLLIPLARMDNIIYQFSDNILSYFFGFVIYAAFYIYRSSKYIYRVKEIVFALLIVVCAILLKSYQVKMPLITFLLGSYVQGFALLIPGINIEINVWPSIITTVLYTLGIMTSVFIMIKIQPKFEKFRIYVAALIIASLCDLWPWRAFQSFSYTLDGGKWTKDYPIWPEFDLENILIVLIFFIVGLLSSWIISKTYSQKIILVHD